MASRTTFARSVIGVVLLTFTAACSTTRPLTAADPSSLASQIAIGDKIQVGRKDGSRLKFKVTEVSPDGLHGRNVFVPFTDIGQVQISEQMHSGTVALLVLLGAAAVYMALEGDDCGDSLWQEACPYE